MTAAEELEGRGRHRAPGILDDELRHLRGDWMLDDQGGGARVDRPIGELVAVEALSAHAEEERALGDRAGVVGEIRDLDSRFPDELARGQAFCDAC